MLYLANELQYVGGVALTFLGVFKHDPWTMALGATLWIEASIFKLGKK